MSNSRMTYSVCTKAIHDLKFFYEKTISDAKFKAEIFSYLDKCESNGEVPIRSILEMASNYRKNSGDYYCPSAEELEEYKSMIDDIIYFWG